MKHRFFQGDFAAPAASDFLNDEKVTNGPGHLPLWRGKAFGRPQGSPLRRKTGGIVGSAKPGAGVEPHQSQFFSYSGPQWGRAEPHPSTPDFARRKDFASFKG